MAVSASAAFAHHPANTLAASSLPMPVPAYLQDIINEASAKYHVDANLIAAVAFKESRYRTTAVSRIGAEGIMQLKPKTARSLGVTDSFDARQNVMGGTKYLRKLMDRFKGDLDLVLAGYNAGPERVAKEGPNATEEAIEYVATVKRYYASALRASSAKG
jgi:soluble lytic murein transglycosylase-like protein